ncbi:hypothetical protein HC031_05835 [Planosporangium thailandense]|uniref:Uncharacterized protein n=1 Tax=Planosporangium thailandense TaxID=765197 RepID=A0ABX0XTB8_9ACTN|nr:hypothetical protein [Planosporangium thailandense]NJC69240.1 hypothetical protein [Planosporangium thailandense]
MPGSSVPATISVRRVLLWSHALVVTLLLVLLYVMTASGPQADANIGAGAVSLVLLGLGLPWTPLLWLVDPQTLDSMAPVIRALMYFGPAVVNVALHAAIPSLIKRMRTV